MTDPAPSLAELDSALRDASSGIGAGELHGSLTGYLCAGGSAGARDWLRALELDDPGTLPDRLAGLLYEDCRRQLDDPDFGFQPLLPGDDAPLAERAEALVAWCRGFLGGAGLAGIGGRPLSEDADEILRDFAGIAASRFDVDGDEEDEAALAEIQEFVRIGVLLLQRELSSAAMPRSSRLH
ncbi:UPF0149 family protein [Dokdonella koreensis]|uniref:YecA family protein n=1 Tax=Dokdonella koreensis DS-123 TaxID=1300342 RepID=A0A167GQG9_9GAMM|nr:UPF0149 family protein [Dokdonella koreensis]ANB17112.1 Hypothetical protein I596_1082 [Dokdonella koreensis DS-123]